MDDEELKDIELTREDCGNTFVHDVEEQQFFKEQNFINPPKRCRPCRRANRARREEQNAKKLADKIADHVEQIAREKAA